MIVMTDPTKGFGSNSNNDINQNLVNAASSGASSDMGSTTEWQGNCYHYCRLSGSSADGTSNPAPAGAQASAPQAAVPATAAGAGGGQPPVNGIPQAPAAVGWNMLPSKEKKPKKKGKHTFLKIAAGVMACLMISAGSVGSFAWLIDKGYVSVGSGGSLFSIVKTTASSSGTQTTNTAASGSLTMQQVASKVIPSVVCIQNYQTSSANALQNGDYFSFGSGNDSSSSNSDSVTPYSEGSGIIASSDGYIITNAHVVSGATSLKVVLSDGTSYTAKLVGSDTVTDLALLKIDATGLTAAEFGDSDSLQVADSVMAVGNPGGLEFNSTVTVGYVSALNREVTNSETGYTMDCIQTDAAINPGNSGGPLVNMQGQVVGITSSKIVATGYESLGFAIPIDTVQPIINDLKQYGYVKDRAVLGISGQYIDSTTARFYGLSTGFYVSSITSNNVTSAGIQKGDVITAIDGTTVDSSSVITSAIANKKPGDTVTLSVTRGTTNQTFTATVTLSQATGQSSASQNS